jgi:hypothetical protein
MRNKQAQRGIGAVWFIIGLMLIASDNSGGWVFFIIGLTHWAATTQQGESWTSKNPKWARWLLAGLTVLTLLTVVIVLVLKRV